MHGADIGLAGNTCLAQSSDGRISPYPVGRGPETGVHAVLSYAKWLVIETVGLSTGS